MQTDRKHILILSSWYPTPEYPFLGNFVQRQAQVLSSYHSITVLHTVPEEGRKNIEIRKSDVPDMHEILVYHPKGTHFLSRRNNRLKALETGLKEVKQPDLIHGHVLIPGGYLFAKAKDHFKCPLVVTEHASYYRPGRKNKLSLKERYVLQTVRRSADRLIAVSDFLRKDMQSLFGDREISVIGNPVNTELFHPSDLEKHNFNYFLHVSTLDTQLKNVQGIIDAVALLVKKGYLEVRLKFISDEPYHTWQNIVNELGLSEYIQFEGPCQPKELVPHFQQASAFVLFSHYETFSIVIAEAWACGIPVISTPVGIAAQVDSSLGINVKDNDSLSLAMAMEKILNDATFDPQTIRKHALQFSDNTIASALNKLYSELHG
jgi:glycosyltransferase involved in cell wall biosynthesis